MTLEDIIRDDVAAFHREIGESVDLVNRTVATDANGDWITDEHGDPEYDTTRETIPAEIALRETPAFNQRAGGLQVDLDAIVWVLEDDAGGSLFTGDEDDEQAPTLLETADRTLRVFAIHHEKNGKIRLHCVE